MGIPRHMIHDLYYSPAPLEKRDPCRQIVDFANKRKVFLSVGALCKRKGTDIFLKAFAQLKTNDWCIVLCGLDRENGLYHRLAERLGITDKVLFLGAYPVKKIAAVYCASDVLVLASRYDGWGAVLNEAASLGLAMIGTEMCGASWHIIHDRENGYRIKEDSVSALKDTLQAYTESPELTQQHGKLAKETYENHFSPAKNASRLLATLKQLTT